MRDFHDGQGRCLLPGFCDTCCPQVQVSGVNRVLTLAIFRWTLQSTLVILVFIPVSVFTTMQRTANHFN